jgi:hypothetical protein
MSEEEQSVPESDSVLPGSAPASLAPADPLVLPGRKMNVEKFLDLLRAGASVGDAARGVGICRATAYNRRKLDPTFAAAWDEAVEEGTDRAETVLAQCALNARKDPKYQTSLIFLLKNRRPKQWRDRQEVDLEQHTCLEVLTDEQRAAIRAARGILEPGLSGPAVLEGPVAGSER